MAGEAGGVRFSVADLLYYAPRFTEVGAALAAAASSAERQLTSLGQFWGHSDPDKHFAASYPPAQDALLIIVRQLGIDLQGVGGGIQVMAKAYASKTRPHSSR